MNAGQRLNGFTLIELLCVIVIISSLAAILFPVLARAKYAAKATQDLAQLAQIGKAMQLYAIDYDDRCPFAITERDRADPEYQDPAMPLLEWNAFKLTIPAVDVVLRPYGAYPALFCSPIDAGCAYGLDRRAPICFAQFGSSYSFLERGRSLTSFRETNKSIYGEITITPQPLENLSDIFMDAVYFDGHAAKSAGLSNE